MMHHTVGVTSTRACATFTLLLLAPVFAGSALGQVTISIQVNRLDADNPRKIQKTEEIAKGLFGAGLAKRTLDLNGGLNWTLELTGEWSLGLALERRNAVVTDLTALWGPSRIEIREKNSRQQAAPTVPRKRPASIPAEPNFDGSVARLGDVSGVAASNASLTPSKSSHLPTLRTAATVGSASAPPAPALSRSGFSKNYPYQALIQKISGETGVPESMIYAVARVKSGMKADMADGDVYGLMGLTERAYRLRGGKSGEILDAESNLRVGAGILASLLKQFDGDESRALAAYQVGPREVLRSGGIPNDRNVTSFLAAYQLALRRFQGGAVPPRSAVQPPTVARRVKDVIQEKVLNAASDTNKVVLIDVATLRAKIGHYVERIVGVDSHIVGVDPGHIGLKRLIEAMVRAESGRNMNARSYMGALGLCQLMPKTAEMLKVENPRDADQNLRGCVAHFKYLLNLYRGDPVLAVAAFNAGEGRVSLKEKRVPNNGETREHVKKVFDINHKLGGEYMDLTAYFTPAPNRKSQ